MKRHWRLGLKYLRVDWLGLYITCRRYTPLSGAWLSIKNPSSNSLAQKLRVKKDHHTKNQQGPCTLTNETQRLDTSLFKGRSVLFISDTKQLQSKNRMVNGFSLCECGQASPFKFFNTKRKKPNNNTFYTKAFYESVMIQPQVHLRLPCYDFYFL